MAGKRLQLRGTITSMTAVTLDLATVETPSTTYVKARALLDEGELTVMDRRRTVLETVTATRVDAGPDMWTYGEVTVRRASGCACGGTRVVNKP